MYAGGNMILLLVFLMPELLPVLLGKMFLKISNARFAEQGKISSRKDSLFLTGILIFFTF